MEEEVFPPLPFYFYKGVVVQYAIFPMPQNPIKVIDRRISFSTERLLWQIEPATLIQNDYKFHNVRLGSVCENIPSNVYKAIYISNDGEWVFEVVYARERGLSRCLYVKTIGSNVTVGISLESIIHYSHTPQPVKPLGHILNDISWMHLGGREASDLQLIVSPIFGKESIDQEVIRLIATDIDLRELTRLQWEPMYRHEPGILGAMITGAFLKDPQNEVQGICSYFNPLSRKNDSAYTLWYRANAFGGRIYCDQFEFDPLILAILKVPISEFSITVSFTDGLECIINTGVLNHYHDPYSQILPRSISYAEDTIKSEGWIVQEAIWLYSQIFDVDVYDRSSTVDRSYVTISKNIFDEVIIEYRDYHASNHVGIYGNLTSLSLVTQSVGYQIKSL